jgi:hypothetical protein
VLIVLITTAQSASAEAGARAAIEAEYHRVCEAASLKFIDGILLCRSPLFKELSTIGQPQDLVQERKNMQQLFSAALTVDETIQVLSFSQKDAHHASCRVQDVLDVLSLDPETREPVRVIVASTAQDDWVGDGSGWQEQCRRIIDQRRRQAAAPVAAPARKATAVPPSAGQ